MNFTLTFRHDAMGGFTDWHEAAMWARGVDLADIDPQPVEFESAGDIVAFAREIDCDVLIGWRDGEAIMEVQD